MDWPVYLINLEKDRTRLEAATAELARVGVPWTRVPAINGRALPSERIAKVYDAKANRARARHPLTPPEIGCYLSHIAAWRAIVSADAPGGVVLEDDFRVTGDFAGAVRAISRDTGGDWDMVKFFTFRPDARHLKPRKIGPGMAISVPYKVPSTMLGYGLKRDAAERLLARTQPFFRPVDEDMKFFWEKQLKIALLSPQPIAIGNQDAHEGTVGDSRRSQKHDRRSPVERFVAGMRYQIGYNLGLHRRRLGE